jgi:hypothetical protein
MVHGISDPSNAATNVTKNSGDFDFNVKYRRQFVAALKDAELSCITISDPDMIIPPQAPLQIQKQHL